MPVCLLVRLCTCLSVCLSVLCVCMLISVFTYSCPCLPAFMCICLFSLFNSVRLSSHRDKLTYMYRHKVCLYLSVGLFVSSGGLFSPRVHLPACVFFCLCVFLSVCISVYCHGICPCTCLLREGLDYPLQWFRSYESCIPAQPSFWERAALGKVTVYSEAHHTQRI